MNSTALRNLGRNSHPFIKSVRIPSVANGGLLPQLFGTSSPHLAHTNTLRELSDLTPRVFCNFFQGSNFMAIHSPQCVNCSKMHSTQSEKKLPAVVSVNM